MQIKNYELLRTLKIHYKIFDNSHLKFGKKRRQKSKNSIFDDSLITNQAFSQTENVTGKSDFAHTMHFH